MKKFLVLLTMMVAVFGFTAGAFAQLPVCENCKCPLRSIPCTLTSDQTGVTTVCNEFDFDLNTAADGYCAWNALNNCRLIFEICHCAAASSFTPGLVVGVKMSILVDGQAGDHGAYWSGTTAPAAITFMDAADYTAACALRPPLARSFGAPSYYLSDGSTAATPLVGAGCTFTPAQKSTILTTGAPGFTIVAGMGAYWQIDVPPIRIDRSVLHNNEVISVKVELYDPRVLPPICPVCVSCLCDCTIPVAQVCCAGPAPATTTLTFNYFTSLTAGDYWNGIAIANSSGNAGTCTLKAYERDGSVGTATIDVGSKSMFVDMLENITFTGTGLGGEYLYMTANCSWGGAFGFAYISDGAGISIGYKVP